MDIKINKYLLSKRKFYKRVTFEDFNDEENFLDYVASLLNMGVDILEFYSPKMSSGKMLMLCRKLRDLTAVFDVLFIIFDRIDIAKLVVADGVVFDKTGLMANDAQKLLEGGMLLGYVLSGGEDIEKLKNEQIDYFVAEKSVETLGKKLFVVDDF